MPQKYQPVFRDLPTTLKGVSKSLHGDESVLVDIQEGSLNLSKEADTVLLGELQLLKDVLAKVSCVVRSESLL